MSYENELSCREVVELVTDYLEGTMVAADRARFEKHLMECEGCAIYLDQVRTTIRVAGNLGEDAILAEQLDWLTLAFRDWKRSEGS